jgi:hypothetical protein
MKKNIIITEQQTDSLIQLLLKSLLGSEYGKLFDKLGSDTNSKKYSNLTDGNFYEKLLTELGAPVTDENLKFLYAWRQSEGKAGKFNPFNTTQGMPGATNFNSVGVKNYLTIDDGMDATLKTLKNGRYNCIVNGLKNNIGAKKISGNCISDLKTWGTGDLVAKVVTSYEKGSEPKIKSLA